MSGEGGGIGGSITRRTILKTVAGAGTAAGAGVGGVLLTTRDEPVLAASGLTAEDVDIKSSDGSVSKLTINPAPTVEWSNLEERADSLYVAYSAELSGSTASDDLIDSKRSNQPDGKDGRVTVPQFDSPPNLLEETGLESSDFEDTTEDGVPEETDVDLRVFTRLENAEAELIISSNDTVTFTVSVDNRKSSVSVSGPMNTGGE